MQFRLLTLLLTIIAMTPLSATEAVLSSCANGKKILSYMGDYPDYHLSPLDSLKLHDVAFMGEVVVPLRKCSLGYCAGLKVVKPLKGEVEKTVLVQVRKPDDQVCAPQNFTDKGQRWLVFANQGTSKTGYKYFYSDDQGPSFITQQEPNFANMQGRYMQMRAALDKAIRMRIR